MGGILKLKNKGFTLIEVVIVLAIAGLIFVVVFLAVGAAQRSRRDTETSSAASRLLAGVDQYVANNNGQMPTACTGAGAGSMANYWNAGGYTCQLGGANPGAGNSTTLVLGLNQVCNAANNGFVAGTRSAAVIFYSETATGVRCVDNN